MLYIMRHGRTEWNDKRKLQGQTEVDLSEKGIEMAKEAREEYKDINFDICFSSTLKRASDTAKIVLEGRNIPIEYDERLIEMGFGEYEGIEKSFDQPECPINVLFRHPEEYNEPVSGAESFDHIYERVNEFLNEKVYPLLDEGKDVLLISHGVTSHTIASIVNNIPRENFWNLKIDNCKLIKLK